MTEQLDMVDWLDQQDERYEVQHYSYVEGWIPNIRMMDDEPSKFSTTEEARRDIDEFLSDAEGSGNYRDDDFRIVDLITNTILNY